MSMVLLKLCNAQKEITAQWDPKSPLTAQPLAITQILEAKMLSHVSLAKAATIVMMMLLATFSNSGFAAFVELFWIESDSVIAVSN